MPCLAVVPEPESVWMSDRVHTTCVLEVEAFEQGSLVFTVGAVGRVRNASPILGSLPLPKCGVRLCYSLGFDHVVFLVQSKSPAEDADHVAFSDNSLLAHCQRYCREGFRCRIWV